ncbi:MAG: hypothetical protein C5B57_09220 [Blastocatellia bacterium]|nr:MAG: hypothetical protein C5B57_09220 [Blastocatellia bacterium]
MRHRFTFIAATGIALAATVGVAGQTRSTVPRAPDGHPDLSGMYDLAMLTPLERPAGLPAVLSDAEAAKLEKSIADQEVKARGPIRGDREAPPKGGDGSIGPAGNVGGYNTFWLDRGTHYSTVDGQKRSSLIVDPADGKVPPMTADGRQRVSRFLTARPTSDTTESTRDPGLEPPGSYDDPERRPLGERCLLGFGSTSGPPVLPNYFYNNLHQIVQTSDSVMILTEMVHDARIVRMNAQHLPATIRKWMGDSIGHWEGDTLVVDTANFTDQTRFRGATENLRVVERFTPVDGKSLKYRFTIEDPATWTGPWTGEYTWPITDEKMYEYACHEANYALGGILSGARQRDREAAK